MDNVSICVSFIAAILGIAYPILLEVVSRLDEKYSSLVVLDLFGKEKVRKFFSVSLIMCLGVLIIYVLKLPPPPKENTLGIDLTNSATTLLIIATVILIFFFFRFISIVLIYYTPTRFLRYLEQQHSRTPTRNNYETFRAIADLLYFSIKQQNETIALSISNFMYRSFMTVRDDQRPKEVVYPRPYYDTIYKTIEELANNKNRRLMFLEHRTAGGVWIMGESGGKISEVSYSWLWHNILLAIRYERDDFIIFHWEQAYQFKQRELKSVREELGDAPDFLLLNLQEISERKLERHRFMEFHYALGGLLLSKQRYHCLKRAFDFTQSLPPQYELLPDTMGEIFHWYFDFSDPYTMKFPDLEHKYNFPELSGLQAGTVIRNWIAEYMAVLFLRQYTIVPYLYGMEPLRKPSVPKKQYEKKQWIDHLPYFKRSLERTLKNAPLLEALELDALTPEWCETHNVPYPLDLMEEVIDSVKGSFDQTQESQDVSPTKYEQFMNTSTAIIGPVLNQYDQVRNHNPIVGEFEKRYISGLSHIMDKSAFAEDQETQHVNYDSILAQTFVEKYTDAISEIFVLGAFRRYLFPTKEIAAAINRLGIDPKDYLFVYFGNDKEEILPLLKAAAISEPDFVHFSKRNYRLVGDSIFFIKKIELPVFTYYAVSEEDINKFELKKIIDAYNIYATVADLHRMPDLKKSIEPTVKERDLDKSVYAGIFIRLEVKWKKGAQWIEFGRSSDYRQQGVLNKLTDVHPL